MRKSKKVLYAPNNSGSIDARKTKVVVQAARPPSELVPAEWWTAESSPRFERVASSAVDLGNGQMLQIARTYEVRGDDVRPWWRLRGPCVPLESREWQEADLKGRRFDIKARINPNTFVADDPPLSQGTVGVELRFAWKGSDRYVLLIWPMRQRPYKNRWSLEDHNEQVLRW